jgi:hypothetical protein
MKNSWRKILTTVAMVCALSPFPTHASDMRAPSPDLGTMKGVEATAFYLGLNAVIWGYPAVKLEQLMRVRASADSVKLGNPQSAVNQLGLVRQLRGPEFKQVATPNNDTLYAQAFCDVSREPLIVSVPKVDDKRYYGIQLWDPNGDTFAYIGTRMTGREAGNYALVGPDWKGTLPDGVKRIDTPYNGLVVWGRIGVDGPSDLDNALAIQDQLRLTPLNEYGKSYKQVPPDLAFSQARLAAPNPQNVTGDLEFFVELANSLKHTPPKAQDAVIAESLSQIGFKDDNTTFDYASLSEPQKAGLTQAVKFGQYLMDVYAQTAGEVVNGWRWSPKSGIMGNDYLFRATFAKWFTGGNAPDEAIYMDGRTDQNGKPLDGSKTYQMHFEKGQLPPAKAFWSVSMYNIVDGSFVENPIRRYTFGDRTPGIVTNADGSLDIFIQHDAPTAPSRRANWLPAPAGGFNLNLRLYVPDDSLQKGAWKPPVVKMVE